MKSYYNLARAISNCWGISGSKREDWDYEKAIGKLLALAKKRDTPRTCGSCRYWFHKRSTDKHWGRCTNEKVHEAMYITFLDIPSAMNMESMMLAAKKCEIRFEENTFGCIHHRGLE